MPVILVEIGPIEPYVHRFVDGISPLVVNDVGPCRVPSYSFYDDGLAEDALEEAEAHCCGPRVCVEGVTLPLEAAVAEAGKT